MENNHRRRRLPHLALLAAALDTLPFGDARAGENDEEKQAMTTDPVHDFDFFFGSWNVQHRRLKERLANNHEWEEFGGTCVARPLLGGGGNIDDNLIHLPGGTYRAVSLRAYDPKTRTWAIWWLDGRHPHTIDTPVVGRFEDGIGTFHSDDTLRGKAIKVRYTWSKITRTSCQWEQAFSPDGGRTWETNWIMRNTRTA